VWLFFFVLSCLPKALQYRRQETMSVTGACFRCMYTGERGGSFRAELVQHVSTTATIGSFFKSFGTLAKIILYLFTYLQKLH